MNYCDFIHKTTESTLSHNRQEVHYIPQQTGSAQFHNRQEVHHPTSAGMWIVKKKIIWNYHALA